MLAHAELGAVMLDEHVELLEGALVEQQFDALARGELALGMLRVDAPLAAARSRLLPPLFQPKKNILHTAPSITGQGRPSLTFRGQPGVLYSERRNAVSR